MKPVITTKGKLAQLRYELPHRARDAQIYPVKAPNGSTILLYGHETGVGVLWRGGRPLKKTAPPKQAAPPPRKVNGTSSDTVMIIDSDDDEPPAKHPAPAPPKAEFEDEEEELDPDQPYPSIIQDVRLNLSAEVLHIALPRVPAVSALRPAESIPAIFRDKIVFSVACAEYSVRIITLPLAPPPHAAKETPLSFQSQYGEEIFRSPSHLSHQSTLRGIDMTWTSRGEPYGEDEADEMDIDGGDASQRPDTRRQRSSSRSASRPGEGWDLLVASHSAEMGGLLKIWRLQLSETSVTGPVLEYQSLTLRTPAAKIAFNSAHYPKTRHSQLLIADREGRVRVYDPFAIPSRKRSTGLEPESGSYIAIFRTNFESPQPHTSVTPALTARKPIVDAAWASDGNSILGLLRGGEWGIWDVSRTGPKPPSDPSALSARGFLGTASRDERTSAISPKSRSGHGSLAPMTPNTRRTKEEKLFASPSSSPSIPPRGGVSVASLQSATGGEPEESAVIWYGTDVYRMPNLAQFWSRNATASDDDALPRPSVPHIQDLKFFGEAITSIDQFDTTVKDARMAVPRDILISTDHQIAILTQVAQPLGRNMDAALGTEEDEDVFARRTDQTLLSRGELDLGGMDRLLDDLEEGRLGKQSLMLGNPRRVLFASSTGA